MFYPFFPLKRIQMHPCITLALRYMIHHREGCRAEQMGSWSSAQAMPTVTLPVNEVSMLGQREREREKKSFAEVSEAGSRKAMGESEGGAQDRPPTLNARANTLAQAHVEERTRRVCVCDVTAAAELQCNLKEWCGLLFVLYVFLITTRLLLTFASTPELYACS